MTGEFSNVSTFAQKATQCELSSVDFFFFNYVKWVPVYHVSTIFGNHVTAGELWVKVTFLSACQQTKWRPDRTKFDGETESQTRVPPVSTFMNNLSALQGLILYNS